MHCQGIRTRLIRQNDDLADILLDSLAQKLVDGSVIVVTSKAVSVAEGSITDCRSDTEFEQLVRREADRVLGKSHRYDFWLTEKQGLIMPNAGIDLSNAESGKAILLPADPQSSANRLRESLKQRTGVENLGIVIADSRVIPFRAGISGIALAWSGFLGVTDERGKPDLYGKPLRVSQMAVADNLASIAQLFFGQADERVPFAIFSDAPVRFTNSPQDSDTAKISAEEDLYTDFFQISPR